ncbi:MAG: SUMF1/EgtB/PvdO family nonheme iron enzyme, partial [Rhodobacteraceae bacterium]|nr:SUMF1/EgtB/PvdO family nonheme iron enzyme [Paracoccaceae bacterium]
MRYFIMALAVLTAPPVFAQAEADLKPGEIVKDCDFCTDLVLVPAGEFTMGSDPALPGTDMNRGEGPQVKINIVKPFLLAKTETTHGQFKRFVEETGYQVKPGCRVWDNEFVDKPEASWRNPYQPAKPLDNHPVGCVSWDDAQAFIAWLSKKIGKAYRLPTEAEWEYAARAGTDTLRFWGDNPDEACHWANTFDVSGQEKYPFPWSHSACKDGYADMAPVGSFKPNPFGLQDMIGNVWE